MTASRAIKSTFLACGIIVVVLIGRVVQLESQNERQHDILDNLKSNLEETLRAENELQTALAMAVYVGSEQNDSDLVKKIALDSIANFYFQYQGTSDLTSRQSDLLKRIQGAIQTRDEIAQEIQKRQRK